MNEPYRDLISGFCRARKLKPLDDLDGVMTLVIGEVLFLVSPMDDGGGVRLQLTVHYGEVSEQAPAVAYRRLLEANVLDLDPTLPKFGIDAETGCVIATGNVPLAGLTPDLLADLLTAQAALVSQWRENMFLTTDELSEAKKALSREAVAAAPQAGALRPRPATFSR